MDQNQAELMGIFQYLKQGRGVPQGSIDRINEHYGNGFDLVSELGIDPNRVIPKSAPVEAYSRFYETPDFARFETEGFELPGENASQTDLRNAGSRWSEFARGATGSRLDAINATERSVNTSFARSLAEQLRGNLTGNNQTFLQDLSTASRATLASAPVPDPTRVVNNSAPAATVDGITNFLAGGGVLDHWDFPVSAAPASGSSGSPAAAPQGTSYTAQSANPGATGPVAFSEADEANYLAANPDVAAAVAAGTMPSGEYHFLNHGQSEIESGSRAPFAAVGSAPQPRYPSLYHEMRGFGLGHPDVDFSNRPVSSAAFQNPHHYVTPTGDTSQLISAMRNGGFRFNPDFYAANNADLALAGIDTVEELIQHYATHGYLEGRAPGVGAPVYVNGTQTRQQAANGVDPIADALRALGQTPNWESSGTGQTNPTDQTDTGNSSGSGNSGGSGSTGGTAGNGNGNGNAGGNQTNGGSQSSETQTGLFTTSYPGAQTVEDRMAEILSRDSTLMRQAATQGRQRAAQRGLLNSSISVGAAQSAVTDAAFDIASQDSAQRFTSDENNANRRLDIYRQDREFAHDAEQRGLDRGHQLTMQDREIGYQTEQRGLDRASNEAMQQREIEYQTIQRGLDRENQELIAEWNLDSTDRANAVAMLTNMSQLYASRWQSIMGNTNLDAESRTAELASINALRDQELDFVRQLFNVQINW